MICESIRVGQYKFELFSITLYSIISRYINTNSTINPESRRISTFNSIIKNIDEEAYNSFEGFVDSVNTSKSSIKINVDEFKSCYNNLLIEFMMGEDAAALSFSPIVSDTVCCFLKGRGFYGNLLKAYIEVYTNRVNAEFKFAKVENIVDNSIQLAINKTTNVICNNITLKKEETYRSNWLKMEDGAYNLGVVETNIFDIENGDSVENESFLSSNYYVTIMENIEKADKHLFAVTTSARGDTRPKTSIVNLLVIKDYEKIQHLLPKKFSCEYLRQPTIGKGEPGNEQRKRETIADGINVYESITRLLSDTISKFDLPKDYQIFLAVLYAKFCRLYYRVVNGEIPSIQIASKTEKDHPWNRAVVLSKFTEIVQGILSALSMKNTLNMENYSLLTFPCNTVRTGRWKDNSNLKELFLYDKIFTMGIDLKAITDIYSKNSIECIMSMLNITKFEKEANTKLTTLDSEFLSMKISSGENIRNAYFNRSLGIKNSNEKRDDKGEYILVNLINSLSDDIIFDGRDESTIDFIKAVVPLVTTPASGLMDELRDTIKSTHLAFHMLRYLIYYCFEISKMDKEGFNIGSTEFISELCTDDLKQKFTDHVLRKFVKYKGKCEFYNILQEKFGVLVKDMSNISTNPNNFVNTLEEIFTSILKELKGSRLFPEWCFLDNRSDSESLFNLYINIMILNYLVISKKYIQEQLSKIRDKLNSSLLCDILYGDYSAGLNQGHWDRVDFLLDKKVNLIYRNSSDVFFQQFLLTVKEHFINSYNSVNGDIIDELMVNRCIIKTVNIWSISEHIFDALQSRLNIFMNYINMRYHKDIFVLTEDNSISTNDIDTIHEAIATSTTFTLFNSIQINDSLVNELTLEVDLVVKEGDLIRDENENVKLFYYPTKDSSANRYYLHSGGVKYNIETKTASALTEAEWLKMKSYI